jgi:hypothetical protein
MAAVGRFYMAYDRMVRDCDLETYIAAYGLEWFTPPMQPYAPMANMHFGLMKEYAAKPFAFTLPPEDLARLAADPAKLARWVELVTYTLLPPLRDLVPIVQTKVSPISLISGVHLRSLGCIDSCTYPAP